MTPREVALQIARQVTDAWDEMTHDRVPHSSSCDPGCRLCELESLIAVAIAEEREACAKEAESWADLPDEGSRRHQCGWEECCAESIGPRIAAAIRARGQEGQP